MPPQKPYIEKEMSSSTPPPIAKHLEVTPYLNSSSDVFQNKHPLWSPGTRGIFGGITIGQGLRAAQLTVPDTFSAHSMHCSFIYAGNTEDNIMYHVESVRNGRSFCTRFVRAVQGDQPIFLAIVSFTLSMGRATATYLDHATTMPANVLETSDNVPGSSELYGVAPDTPFVNKSVGVLKTSAGSSSPQDKRIHQWIRARGTLVSQAGDPLHLAALAFISDSYFLAAVPHSHGIWGFVRVPVSEFYSASKDMFAPSKTHAAIQRPHLDSSRDNDEDESPRVAMMVSLDHTIYFHNTEGLRADQWLLAEVQSSWAGEGRGLVHQKIWTRDGTLVATCIQEVGL